jgi:hypothetical protein
MQVIDTTVPDNMPNIRVFRLYNELSNALSDLITGNIGCEIEDKTNSPWFIKTGGTKPNGYDDDFEFVYTSGIRIVVGEVFIQDNIGGTKDGNVNQT